jgi:hypothetical protein
MKKLSILLRRFALPAAASVAVCGMFTALHAAPSWLYWTLWGAYISGVVAWLAFVGWDLHRMAIQEKETLKEIADLTGEISCELTRTGPRIGSIRFLRRELETAKAENETVLEYARKVYGSGDVTSVYEVLDRLRHELDVAQSQGKILMRQPIGPSSA